MHKIIIFWKMICLDTMDKPTPLFRLEKYFCEYEIEKNTIEREYIHLGI